MNAELFEPDDFQLTPHNTEQSLAAQQAGRARRGRTKTAPEQQSMDEWMRGYDYGAGAFTSDEQYRLTQRFEAATLAAEGHAYAQRKGIRVQHEGSPIPLRQQGCELLLPVQDTAGAIQGVQRILPNGNKQQWPGSTMTGCFHLIGASLETAQCVCVAEGLATGASAHEITGLPVAVTCGAGNMAEAAKAIRFARPSLPIIVLPDDDWHGDAALAGKAVKGNAGMQAAHTAALAVGGKLAVPVFPAGHARREDETDFNDLAQLPDGAALVRKCIEAAQAVTDGAVADAAEGAGDAWEEPPPLPDKLPPVEPFNEQLLPEPLRAWVMDIAERADCPPDYTAAATLSALGSLLGARVLACPYLHNDYTVAANLWMAAIGAPGVKKSGCVAEPLDMLESLKAAEKTRHTEALRVWQAKDKLRQMARERVEKEAKQLVFAGDTAGAEALLLQGDEGGDDKPQRRTFFTNDPSVESLQERMECDPWGFMLARDELMGWLRSLEKQGQETARAFYLEAWNGKGSYEIQRIGRGEHFLPRVCLTVAGTIQPDIFLPYVRRAVAGGGDGLPQRFSLALWPDMPKAVRLIDRKPNKAAYEQARAVFERFAQIEPLAVPQPDGGVNYEPLTLRFTSEARALYEQWLRPLLEEIRAGDIRPALAAHLAKYEKLVPALALIFCMVDCPDACEIAAEHVARALAWAHYLRSHAERIYGAAETPDMDAARWLLQKLQDGKLEKGSEPLAVFEPRIVAQKHWTGLCDVDAVRRAADVLVVYGWLQREEQRGSAGGRPSVRYVLHPCLRERGAA